MNVLIYGAGCPGKMLKNKLTKCHILAFVDRNKTFYGTAFENIPVIAPEEIGQYSYDFIIISNRHGSEITRYLISELNVKPGKIIDYSRGLMIDDRVAVLRLISEIVNKTNGVCVAEVGVYKGEFAQYINSFFPQNKLYLIDTFQGFLENDTEIENKNGYSLAAPGQYNFSDVNAVMDRMTYPENCIVKKGKVQHITKVDEELINSRFCYVSIDVDLYAPILSALYFFWERMCRGGYIMVHDYNNGEFKGTKRAVDEFCAKKSIFLCPIPDAGGTAVLVKNTVNEKD